MPEPNHHAVEVRELCAEAATLLNAGDRRWRKVLRRAERLTQRIDDPFSRDDAISRVAMLASHEALLDGDQAAAVAHLEADLAAIGRQRARVDEGAGQRRLDDHEWVSRYNFAQLLRALGDFDGARRQHDRCDALAPHTLDPADRHRAGVLDRAAIDLASERLPQALAGYAEAVELHRGAEPDALGSALLGLAQAQLLTGSFAQAAANLDGAEPLLADDADGLARVRQLRAQLAQFQQLADQAERARDYAALDDELDVLPGHRRQAAIAAAHAHHAAGDLDAATAAYAELIVDARASGDRRWLADVLGGSANATQDLALALAPDLARRAHATRLHHAALAQLTEARDLIAEAGEVLRLAALDVAFADYQAQWHPQVDGMNVQLLRAALQRADAAQASLRAVSLEAATAASRRDFAALHATHGFEVACSLAFRLGDSATLARLIEERSAGYDWRAART